MEIIKQFQGFCEKMINKNMELAPLHIEKKIKVSAKKQLSTFCSAYIQGISNRRTSISNFSTLTSHKKKQSCSVLIPPQSTLTAKDNVEPLNTLSMKIRVESTYSEKLLQVEKIINDCKELSIQFGFFYLTKAMIEMQSQVKKVSCWIHPNRKINKPLHPIIKANHFEAERQFYFKLKSFLKELYPTIPQPFGNSYQQLKQHIKLLQKSASKNFLRKKSFNALQETAKTLARVKSEEQVLREKQKQLCELLSINSPKLEKTIQILNIEERKIPCQKSFQNPQYCSEIEKANEEYQKNTMSTLIGSLNSKGSFRKRLLQEKKKCFQREYQGKKSVIIENKEQNAKQQENEHSGGLQLDFDELFSQNSEQLERQLQLEKVSKQFEDLLFD